LVPSVEFINDKYSNFILGSGSGDSDKEEFSVHKIDINCKFFRQEKKMVLLDGMAEFKKLLAAIKLQSPGAKIILGLEFSCGGLKPSGELKPICIDDDRKPRVLITSLTIFSPALLDTCLSQNNLARNTNAVLFGVARRSGR
jgi:hypothetical protein